MLNPDYPTGHHWFAFYHLTVGDTAQALAEMKKAHDLDPLSPVISVELGWFLFYARRYEETEQAALKTLQLQPSNGYAYSMLVRSYAIRGREAEAREAEVVAPLGPGAVRWPHQGAQGRDHDDRPPADPSRWNTASM